MLSYWSAFQIRVEKSEPRQFRITFDTQMQRQSINHQSINLNWSVKAS